MEFKHGDIFTEKEAKELKLPNYPSQIRCSNAPYMWKKGYKGKGIKIAIIDSGCDINHPLLKNKIKKCVNLTSDDDYDESKVTDYSGHGTHVAGIIAGGKLGRTYIGVAPECELFIYKVIDKQGRASYDTMARAIYSATQSGVDIINLSMGGNREAPNIHEAIKYANRAGIPVCVAVGNSGDGDSETAELLYPACYNESICVGSINDNFKISEFSNSNQYVDVVSVGDTVFSLSPNNEYKVLSGTSQATPIVSACLGLLKQWATSEYHRPLLEVELYSLLIKNTKSIKNIDRKLQGNGYVFLSPVENV